MYRIALCDDEITELDKTEMMLHNYQKSDTEYELEISRFGSAEQLLERVRKQGYKPDLLLLDVYMPKKLGTEAAKELRDMGSDSRIVFLTASVTHALEAFRVDAVQYLVKPVLERELFLVLDKFLGEIERERKKYLLLKIDGRICRVALQEIVYCEAQRKYQYLYLTNGTRSQLRLTMAEIYKMLSDYTEFVKVGVSYIVNLEHIESLNSQEIQLDSGERLHLPRGAYQPLKEQYFQYYCRGGIQNDSGNHTVFIRTS